MRTRTTFSVLAFTALAVGAFALFAGTPASAQCLSEAECDALKAQLHDFRDEIRPIRREARELRKKARELPRGSEERRALRRQARQLRREFRQARRASEIRRVYIAYRDGCRRC